ncbi:MAG: orotate phosphoribosyltransferase [Bacteroidales bacterium]|jgi:orotate phosphoribosyltransferase|nr:orotate phosphoribosyltransferase [Bacteroidales bacterium]
MEFESVEKNISRQLLKVKAVTLSLDNPYTWASGWKSPIYCDNRKLLSYPDIRRAVCDAFVKIIENKYKDQVDYIAGVATGGIPYGIMVAEKLNKPFVYVRPKPKDHGLNAQIEGDLERGSKVVLVEDLISTGSSSLSAADCIAKSGSIVLGMVAIFSYNFSSARRAFEYANVEMRTLSNYDALLDEAIAEKYIKESDLEVLKQWRISPDKWGK